MCPFRTITTLGTQNQLVTATLVKNNHGDKQAFDIREPLRTVVAGGSITPWCSAGSHRSRRS